MLIPLSVPWAVVAALAVPVLVHTLTVRPPEHVPLWVGSLLVVPVVVAASLSIDRFHVSESELLRSTEAAVGSLQGTSAAEFDQRLAAGVRERLGRTVDVEAVEGVASSDDSGSRDSALEVRLARHAGDPAACVELITVGDDSIRGEPGYVMATVSGGRCDGP